MNASKLKTVKEWPALNEAGKETEDRIFRDESGSYWWQCRGSSDCEGPFPTRDDAQDDYANA